MIPLVKTTGFGWFSWTFSPILILVIKASVPITHEIHITRKYSSIDPSFWTAHQVLPDHPTSLWNSGGVEDPVAQ
jgi:hypothetical protein